MLSAMDAGHVSQSISTSNNNTICWRHSFTNHYTPRTHNAPHYNALHTHTHMHTCTHTQGMYRGCITIDVQYISIVQYIRMYLSKLRQSKTYGLSGLKRTSRSWNVSSHFSLLCLIRIKYCWLDECCTVMSSWRTSPMTGNLSFTTSRTVVSERLHKETSLHHNSTLSMTYIHK